MNGDWGVRGKKEIENLAHYFPAVKEHFVSFSEAILRNTRLLFTCRVREGRNQKQWKSIQWSSRGVNALTALEWIRSWQTHGRVCISCRRTTPRSRLLKLRRQLRSECRWAGTESMWHHMITGKTGWSSRCLWQYFPVPTVTHEKAH